MGDQSQLTQDMMLGSTLQVFCMYLFPKNAVRPVTFAEVTRMSLLYLIAERYKFKFWGTRWFLVLLVFFSDLTFTVYIDIK